MTETNTINLTFILSLIVIAIWMVGMASPPSLVH